MTRLGSLIVVALTGCHVHSGNNPSTGLDTLPAIDACPNYGCSTCPGDIQPGPEPGCAIGTSCDYEDWEHGCSCTCTELGRWACANQTIGSMCPVGTFGAWYPGIPLTASASPRAELAPTFNGDRSMLVFVRVAASGAHELWSTTPVPHTVDWSAPVQVMSGGAVATGDDPTLSEDGNTLYWERGGAIVSATRNSDGTWTAASAVPGLAGYGSPDFARHDLVLVVASLGANPNLYELQRATTSSPWSAPQLIAELATPSVERAPTMRDDGLELYFESNRSGTAAIYQAQRQDVGQAWQLVGKANLGATGPTSDPELSSDGGTLLFVGGTSNKDIDSVVRDYQ
jgi:Tol biopolymer transport system component